MKTSHLFITLLVPMVIVGCAPTTPSTPKPLSQIASADRLASDIEFHKLRVKTDPQGAIGFAMLSEAYLALARAKDDDIAAKNAEDAALKSLKIRTIGNSRAAMRLTQARLAQHRFLDAEKSAQMAYTLSGGSDQTARMLGEVQLEIGRYDEFKRLIAKSPKLNESPEGLTLLARWNEIIGHPEKSIAMMRSAVAMVDKAGAGQKVAAAWFRTQLGWTALRAGDETLAQEFFERAIVDSPYERKAYAGIAKIALEKSEWNKVIEFGDKANGVATLTDVLGWQAIALKNIGDTPRLKIALSKIDSINNVSASETIAHHHKTESRHTHSRLYATFAADYGRNLQIGHHIAEEDLQWRKDIHAYDAFAWATFRYWLIDPVAKKTEGNVLLKEAFAASQKAMATGTKDVEITSHAKEIYKAMKNM